MMKVTRAVNFGLAMCNALGMDPATVRSLTVTAQAEGVLMVNVELYSTPLSSEQLTAIADALKADGKTLTIKRGGVDEVYTFASAEIEQLVADDEVTT